MPARASEMARAGGRENCLHCFLHASWPFKRSTFAAQLEGQTSERNHGFYGGFRNMNDWGGKSKVHLPACCNKLIGWHCFAPSLRKSILSCPYIFQPLPWKCSFKSQGRKRAEWQSTLSNKSRVNKVAFGPLTWEPAIMEWGGQLAPEVPQLGLHKLPKSDMELHWRLFVQKGD